MEKYPLSVIQHTLIEWKYAKTYSNESKTYDLKERPNGEVDIILRNKIRIVNKGGSFNLKIEPVKFHTTTLAFASLDDDPENDRLKDFLRYFDNEVYIKAEESEKNTEDHPPFFER